MSDLRTREKIEIAKERRKEFRNRRTRVAVTIVMIAVVCFMNSNGVLLNQVSAFFSSFEENRTIKQTLQDSVSPYELNIILALVGLEDKSKLTNITSLKDEIPKGTFTNLDELFGSVGESLEENRDYYNSYRENDVKPIEQQEFMDMPQGKHYLAVSDVTISYFYDPDRELLSQLVRVVSTDRVFRCTIVYNDEGQPIHYFEA